MQIAAKNELTRFIDTAYSKGVSDDQVRRFIQHAYIPQPKQLDLHALARLAQTTIIRYVVQGGTRSSSKTHTALAQVGLDDCQRCPGLKVLFLRKIQQAAKESFEDVTTKVFRGMDYKKPGVDKTLRFANGSRIVFGGYKDEDDIDKYLGIEYDCIVVEEATQLTEMKIDKIDGSLRTTRDDWRAVMYLTFNPEGVGLQWAKKRHYLPWKEGREEGTRSRFVFSTYKDNKYTDPDYIIYLENLPGALGKAWRDGNFDVFIGQAFPNFRKDIHVITPFEIPRSWIKWVGIDDGYAKPWAALWFTIDPMPPNRLYVIGERYEKLLTNAEQANIIKEYTHSDWKIRRYWADPNMFTRSHRRKARSAADIYWEECGIRLKKADNNRIAGKRRIDDFLSTASDGLPKVQIFDVCENLIDELIHLLFDEYKSEDVDTTMPDHAYDAFRYGTTDRKKQKSSRYDRQTRRAIAAIGRF